MLAAVPDGALATPLNDKRAQALRVKTQLEQLDEQLEIVVEEYNDATIAYREATERVRASERRLARTKARIASLQARLDTRVQGMYRTGPLGFLEVLLSASTFEEFASTWDMLRALSEQDATTLAELKETRQQLSRTLTTLEADRAEAKAERDKVAARKRQIEKRLQERKRLLSGLEDEIAQLQRAEAERERRRWRPPADLGDPVRAPRSEVVRIALGKLGAPYRWGAAGPDAFDCSGFTMWVYAQVGVSLPHSSRAQMQCGERVSRANLRPGDLVFFGRTVVHHVGIYIGGGMYVHAPHTGDVVKISSVDRRDYAGACRP